MKDKTVMSKLGGLIKNKYALIVLGVGLVILLLPTGGNKTDENTETTATTEITAPDFSVENEEKRLESLLSKIKGAGQVSVLLSVGGSVSRELAESGEETLVLSSSGNQKVVELYYVNPTYLGAVIVCEGAGASRVRLEITQAVTAFTGLKADKIRVMEMA